MGSMYYIGITIIGVGNVIAGMIMVTGFIFSVRIPRLLDERIADGRISLEEYGRKPYYRYGGIAIIFSGMLLFYLMTYSPWFYWLK